MNRQLRTYLDEQIQSLDDDIRQAIEIADGDIHRAIRITLIANKFLQEENEQLRALVSKGFRRKTSGRVPENLDEP